MDTEQAKPNEKPYRVKEFADRADVSPNAVYEMIRRGEVQAVRFGRAIRIPRDAGDRMLRGDRLLDPAPGRHGRSG